MCVCVCIKRTYIISQNCRFKTDLSASGVLIEILPVGRIHVSRKCNCLLLSCSKLGHQHRCQYAELNHRQCGQCVELGHQQRCQCVERVHGACRWRCWLWQGAIKWRLSSVTTGHDRTALLKPSQPYSFQLPDQDIFDQVVGLFVGTDHLENSKHLM